MPQSMTRRDFAASLAAAALASQAKAQSRPPNVVFIISDDQHYGDYSFLDHPHIQTPRIDALAAESLTFTRGYAAAPLCCPSLAAMLSGLHPHQSGITSNDPKMPAGVPKPQAYKSPEVVAQREQCFEMYRQAPMLPRLLAAKGYVSLQTGKWWGGAPSNAGFTEGMTIGDPLKGGRHGDEGLKIGRETMDPVHDFLDRHKQDPFFLWFAPMMPHQPHNPPDRLLNKYKPLTPSEHVAKYWAMCEWWDEVVGQMLDALDSRGLTDNTIVVYLCDNGWIQDPEAARNAPRSKRSVYEGGIRTPVMVRYPGQIEHKLDRQIPVSAVDLLPTILPFCGLQPTKEMTGTSLLDRFNIRRRHGVSGAGYTHDAVDVTKPLANLQWRFRADQRWKLILPHKASQPNDVKELYDLPADPAEQKNLAAEYPNLVKPLEEELERFLPVP